MAMERTQKKSKRPAGVAAEVNSDGGTSVHYIFRYVYAPDRFKHLSCYQEPSTPQRVKFVPRLYARLSVALTGCVRKRAVLS